MKWKRWIARAPLVWWRMGWHGLLGRVFLLLTTTGRKSGLPRYALVEYHYLDGLIYIPSGRGNRSQWFRNLSEDPEVTIQLNDKPRYVVATPVTEAEEVARLLKVIHRRNPFFIRFFKATGIERPDPQLIIDNADKLAFVRLEPGVQGPPSMKQDLIWVNGLILLGLWWLVRSC